MRALVTGASGGIGRAVAQAFAAQGDRVAVHYGSSALEGRRTLDSLAGSGHAGVQADLTDALAVRAAVDGAADDLGGLDVLVNNAGVFLAHPPTATSYDAWQVAWAQTLGVNLVGAANATFCAVPHLRAAGGGAIVNVSSRGAFRGEPDCPAYAASKAGLNAFGQSMALARHQRRHRGPRVRRDRDGRSGARRARRRRRARAVAVRSRREGRRGGCRGGLAGLPAGALHQRHHRRRQRCVVSSKLSPARGAESFEPVGPASAELARASLWLR